MFFEKEQQIINIAEKTSCSIFVMEPEKVQIKLKHALYLQPDTDKKSNIITVDQIRDFISLTTSREISERFFVITPAESMNEAAQNAFLKTFEEPSPHCHFVLITQNPSMLLPTILSRAQIFVHKIANTLDQPPNASEKILGYAKRLIATSARDLPSIADELAKTKNQPREQAMQVTAAAIELLYKSYFKTGNTKFLAKVQNFIKLYEHLGQNCHIKLHLVADLC